jgi:predicted dehydrogenase
MVEARLRVGVVGVGRWGSKIARTLTRLPAVEIAALCDLGFATSEPLSTAWMGYRRSASFEALLEDPAIDALLIATPPEQHCSMVLAALRAQKHVFVEKPMALSITDAEQIAACAASSDRALMVGHLMHYHPAVKQVFELVDGGEIGRPLAMLGERTSARSMPHGDAWWVLAPHDVSLAQRALGSDCRHVGARVMGHTVSATLRFPNGQALLRVGCSDPKRVRRLAWIGSERTLLLDEDAHEPRLVRVETTKAIIDLAAETTTEWSWDDLVQSAARNERIEVHRGEALLEELSHFVSCARYESRPWTDANEGLAVTRILVAGQSALEAQGDRVAPSLVRSRAERRPLGAESLLALELS